MKLNLELMEEYLTKKQIVWVGVLSLVLTIVFFGLSYFFISNTIEAVSLAKKSGDRNVSRDACINDLQNFGGLKIQVVNDDVISLSSNDLENAALRLGEASVASLVCPGWELSSFCMGESCKNGEGLEFELQIID